VLLGVALLGFSQMKLTVEQLTTFLRSSVQLRHDDRKVAEYLKKVRLTERLDDRQVEELLSFGLGPRTIEALRQLRDSSASLPAPEPPKPKPVAPTIPPPSPKEQIAVLEKARENALNYDKQLPDFICTQVTRRYVDPSGLEFWQRQDVITERLSYFEGKEDYQVVLINNQPVTNVRHDQLGGATSSGEFGSMLREIFEPATETLFQWERWATLRGRRMHVFSFRVAQDRSKYRIVYRGLADVIAAYRGLVYVDRDNLMVMRIRMETENLPSSFPIQQVSVDLNYDMIEISDRPYLLPLKSELRSREGRLLVKNETEFHRYRKFGVDVSVSFDTPDPIPEEKTKEEPVRQDPSKPDLSKPDPGKKR
jgi:hypothetical protein